MQDHHHSGLRQLCRRFLAVILIITTNDLQEIISEPIHIPSHSSSCIDVIFSNNSNFVLDGGVHPSLHPHFHQQFTHCKFNFKVEYLPRFQSLVWNSKNPIVMWLKKLLKESIGILFSEKNVYSNISIALEIQNYYCTRIHVPLTLQ